MVLSANGCILLTVGSVNYNLSYKTVTSFLFLVTERQETQKLHRRNVFCQITQHLLENHEMWKRVIAAEGSEETQKEKDNCLGNPVDSITAIHEEEEEQAGKEEESADDLDDGEEAAAVKEKEVLPQSETSGDKEEVPE